MTEITITVKNGKIYEGLYKVAERLPGLTKASLGRTWQKVKKVASGGYSGGTSYAVPPPPNSTYRRTGTYGRSFVASLDGTLRTGLRAKLVSNATRRGRGYTRYVGGMADGTGQAGIHAKRWPLIRETVQDGIKEINRDINSALKSLLRAEGMGL
jgi:hypothetical protein